MSRHDGAGSTVTKHFSWAWQELPSAEGAAWSETWRYDAAGDLVSRSRTALDKQPAGPTISTDPRAGEIMREELAKRGLPRTPGNEVPRTRREGLGLRPRATPMGGPHH